MSSRIRLCSGAKVVQKLQRAGWIIARQKGSHIMMTKSNYQYTLSIPQHKELGVGIISKLIKQANLTVDEFNEL